MCTCDLSIEIALKLFLIFKSRLPPKNDIAKIWFVGLVKKIAFK